MRVERLRGYGLALVAAALWATLGLFYGRLAAYGLSRLTIVFYRAALTATMLFIVLGWPFGFAQDRLFGFAPRLLGTGSGQAAA